MSKFRDRYKSAREKPSRGGDAAADFEALPELSTAMSGIPNSDGRGWDIPPHTLTIWLEGTLCKFCLSCEGSDVKTFGTFPALSDGLDGVEKALTAGNCETKRAASRQVR